MHKWVWNFFFTYKTPGSKKNFFHKMTRHRAWCWTLNNYNADEEAAIKAALQKANYAVCGHEVGDSGTPHLQGYFQWPTLISFKQVKEKLGERAHVEPAKGSPVQNKGYCTKGGSYWEIGECKRQGERTDLEDIRKKVKEGQTFTTLIEDGYSLQALKYAEKIMPYIQPPQREKPTVYWFHGPSGAGKTRTAMEMANGRSYWVSPAGKLQWFDGYDGQDVVILDDYRASDSAYHDMLRLLDRYPCRVPIKGSYREWKPKVIIITSRYKPELTFNLSEKDDIAQILRRIDRVRDFQREPYIDQVRYDLDLDQRSGNTRPTSDLGSEAHAPRRASSAYKI